MGVIKHIILVILYVKLYNRNWNENVHKLIDTTEVFVIIRTYERNTSFVINTHNIPKIAPSGLGCAQISQWIWSIYNNIVYVYKHHSSSKINFINIPSAEEDHLPIIIVICKSNWTDSCLYYTRVTFANDFSAMVKLLITKIKSEQEHVYPSWKGCTSKVSLFL